MKYLRSCLDDEISELYAFNAGLKIKLYFGVKVKFSLFCRRILEEDIVELGFVLMLKSSPLL
jgi:hypothetical protein